MQECPPPCVIAVCQAASHGTGNRMAHRPCRPVHWNAWDHVNESATSSEGAPDIQSHTCTARQPHTYSTPYVRPSQAMQGESSPSEKDTPNPPRRQQGPTVHTPYSSPK
ncbi:hypothetical protein BDV41DRAFT_467069 [Aspergillus transmontanensis]|uniref:Uncharacterized protein n=1 Tax=Aspergillus transmontanensis TaxID=1034304 RepID=A0A5N6VKI9_9EURO|nr:hypothetical protein BDV41DRAFT_467069 [Aspergillus transmontanensis]